MNRRGVSLVEVLVVTLILSLLSGVVLVLAQTGTQVWHGTGARLTTLMYAQLAVDRVNRDVRSACRSTVACAPNQLTFKLSPSCDASGLLITYQQVGDNLTRQVGGASPITVASGLKAFGATCSNGLVIVTLTTEANDALTGPSAQTLVSKVWGQNP